MVINCSVIKLLVLFFSTICILICIESHASIIYVNHAASGSNIGTSWTNSYTNLKIALNNSVAGDEIWVASGTYYPSATQTTSEYFLVKSNVKLYGGFLGNEISLSQRDANVNETILSGEYGIIGDYTNNAATLLRMDNCINTTIVNGFTLTHARSYNISCTNSNSQIENCKIINSNYQGIYINQSAPNIIKCEFYNNLSSIGSINSNSHISECIFRDNKLYGGCLNASGSGGTDKHYFINCIFKNNLSPSHSPVFTLSYNVTLVMDSCEFLNNHATTHSGIGVASNNCNINLNSCKFFGNKADDHTGLFRLSFSSQLNMNSCQVRGNQAIYSNLIGTSQSSVKIVNTEFSSNSYLSGLIGLDDASALKIINSTFYKNAGTAGLITCLGSNQPTFPVDIINSLFWNNTPGNFTQYGSTRTIAATHSLIDIAGVSNININPLFKDPDGADNIYGNADDDLEPDFCSPVIDKGMPDTSGLTIPSLDLNLLSRIYNNTIDIGAYENHGKFMPSIFPANDLTICHGDSMLFHTPALFPFFEWTNGKTTNDFYAKSSGDYAVRITTVNNCVSPYSPTTSLMVSLAPATPSISSIGQDSLEATTSLNGYTWFFDGSLMDEHTKKIKVTKTGCYKVMVKDGQACHSDTSENFCLVISSSDNYLISDPNVRIAPVPAHDYAIVTSNNLTLDNITLRSLYGNLLWSKELLRTENEIFIDTQSLPPGFYLVELRANGLLYFSKLIVE